MSWATLRASRSRGSATRAARGRGRPSESPSAHALAAGTCRALALARGQGPGSRSDSSGRALGSPAAGRRTGTVFRLHPGEGELWSRDRLVGASRRVAGQQDELLDRLVEESTACWRPPHRAAPAVLECLRHCASFFSAKLIRCKGILSRGTKRRSGGLRLHLISCSPLWYRTPQRHRSTRCDRDRRGQSREHAQGDPQGPGRRDLPDNRWAAHEADPSEGRHNGYGCPGVDARDTAGRAEHRRNHERESEPEAAECSEKGSGLIRHETDHETERGDAGQNGEKALGAPPSEPSFCRTAAHLPSPANRR